MKSLLIVTLFLCSFLQANNDSYKNIGKIDMHGNNDKKLMDNQNSFGNKDLNSIGILKPKNPKEPNRPKSLIENKKDKEK